MVGPSKILTVSYGTFSCTLEGFDNPFSTMRGIAEYFRDIAADDRYFGAEPPIPDADMLHRIAQNDAQKRVVAHVESNGVTLRQVEDDEIAPAPAMVTTPQAQVLDPFVDEPADTVALNEPDAVQAESVAAKLARIRAVVSNDNVATNLSDSAEDEVFTTSPISAAFADTVAEYSETDAAKTTPGDETASDEAPEKSAEATAEAEADTQDESETPVTDQTDSDTIAEFMGERETADDSDQGDEGDASDDPDSSSISRVVKMRRSDFDAAQEMAVDGDQDQGDGTGDLGDDPVSSLSAEDEAELMANLAEVQRKADAEHRSEKEGRALLENKDIESSSESVSRILEVTNTEMQETEGTRRRSAIAHLKAAVAATRADKFLTSKREQEDADELNQYRDDLAKVVKPRRPAESSRPARQAPLMLVSEQRVDEPAQQEVVLGGPAVAPRRVSAEEQAATDADGDNIFLENNTFAEFAAEMGALELPDLLEAAAAYSAYIQGQEHFSRPQIMQAVAAVHAEEFSREEGLRSFGLLLRRGKIKKLKRGQFTVADTTRFHPQPRAVGE